MSEDRPCHKDLQPPVSAKYVLKNEKSGLADGTIVVTVDKDRNSATDIIPFWANEKGILPGFMPLYAFRITGETTRFELSGNVIIPKGATKLFLFASDFDTSATTEQPFVIDLPKGAASDENFGELVTEFQVISDLHVAADPTPFARILSDIIEFSPDSIGLFIDGDITQCGADSEYQKFLEIYNSFKNAPDYYASIGNHDFYQAKAGRETRRQARERFLKVARYPDGKKPESQHYDFWLSGYHFVFLGDDETAGDYLSSAFNDETMEWLRSVLGSNRDAERPIFLFHHQPIRYTVVGSFDDYDRLRDPDGIARRAVFTGLWGENAAKLRTVLKDFPEVILFSGHQHISLGYPNTVKLRDNELPTIVNTASASQAATIRDHIKEKGKGSEGFYVYVYKDKIILRGRDFKAKKWIPSAQFCVYTGKGEDHENSL